MILLLAMTAGAAEVWTDVGVDVRVSDPVSVELGETVRVDTSPARINDALTQVGTTVRFNDTWRLGLGYRAGSSYDDPDGHIFGHRLNVDGSARWRFGELRMQFRERYQVRLKAAGKDTRHTLRSRLRAEMDFGVPVRPRIAIEPFLNLGDGDRTGSGVGIDKVRLDFGIEVPLDAVDIGLLYRYEVPIRDAVGSHIIATSFTFNLDLRSDD